MSTTQKNNGTGVAKATVKKAGRPGASLVKRILYIFILLDKSISMAREKIQVTNNTLHGEIEEWRKIAEDRGVTIKLQIIQFGRGAEAMFAEPVDVMELDYEDVVADGEATDNGEAFHVLNGQLNNVIANHMISPLVVELSDGVPTDDYKEQLDALKKNPLFKTSVKVAVAIGDEAGESKCLSDFTGNKEMVIVADNNNPGDISKKIKWATTGSILRATSGKDNSGKENDSLVPEDLKKVKKPDSIVTW